MSDFYGGIYFLQGFGVLRLRVSFGAFIGCITKVIGIDSIGVGRRDVEQVLKSLYQFVLRLYLIITKNSTYLLETTARIRGFLQ